MFCILLFSGIELYMVDNDEAFLYRIFIEYQVDNKSIFISNTNEDQ